MRSIRKYPKILEVQKKYKFLEKQVDLARNQYKKILMKSKCETCNLFNPNFFKLSIEDRHKNCETCKNGSPILKAAELIINLKNYRDTFERDVYASTIFDELNKEKPMLLDERTNIVVEWTRAFGSSYLENVNNNNYAKLINLFEGDVGPFHFVE
jgi:hypothetical protein